MKTVLQKIQGSRRTISSKWPNSSPDIDIVGVLRIGFVLFIQFKIIPFRCFNQGPEYKQKLKLQYTHRQSRTIFSSKWLQSETSKGAFFVHVAHQCSSLPLIIEN